MAAVAMNVRARVANTSRQTRRVVVTRASAQQPKQESRREFARNAAFLAAAALVSVVPNVPAAKADEIPEKLKKKICANNATAKMCIK
mmetsp:Transcript_22528/g.47448  ORF Transcript_22528/g.47448 Transcript_22528/m.47448 type:complete len:88 (+) Transcript_22528:136-399(+)